MIVPTKRRIRHLTREVIQASPGKAIPSLPIHTLGTFSLEMLKEITPHRRVLHGTMQTLLLYKALLAAGDELLFFSLRNRMPRLHRGTFEKIVNVVNRMKETGIYPGQLREEMALADADESQKLADITTIYERYEAELEAIHAVDPAGITKLLAVGCTLSQFESAFRKKFFNVDTVSVSGFDEFSEPELGLIAKIAALPELTVHLTFDYMHGNPALFGQLEENYRRFMSIGFTPSPTPDREGTDETDTFTTSGGEDRNDIPRLAQQLFARAEIGSRADLRKHVTVVKARNRIEEVETVCKQLKQLILDRPDRELGRMCVAMPHPGPYTPLLRSAFAKFGIPANITDRYSLAAAPVVVAILGLLQLPARGFRREEVIRVTLSPYLQPLGNTPFDAAGLHAVASRLRVPGGHAAWITAFDREIARGNNHREKHAEGEPGLLASARSSFDTLCNLLLPFQEPRTPREFHVRFHLLLEQMQLRRSLAASSPFTNPAQKEAEVKAYARLLETIGDTLKLIEYEHGPDQTHPLEYYLEYIRISASDERYNVREQFGRGVLVTAIEETRGLPMDVMVLIGLVDGEFPSIYQPEVFMSHERQKRRAQRHTWEHRYLFYQAISNFSEHLYLTCPELDEEVELIPSSFLDALDDVAEVEHVTADTLLPGEVAFSTEDFLVSLGTLTGKGVPVIEEIPPPLEDRFAHIQRSILVEQSRMQTHVLGSYEGLIGNDISTGLQDRLKSLRSRVFSISQLESYGKCPFQFFAQRVLGLKQPDELPDELSPLERGDILHDILFHFFLSRRDRGLPPLKGCSDAEFEVAVHDLFSLGTRRFAGQDILDPFWELEKELWLGHDGHPNGLLLEFLMHERQRTTALEPSFFEVAFGPGMQKHGSSDPLLSSQQPVPAGRISLRGKVDRVETGSGVFAIVDYKTGSSLPLLETMREGTSLQLPLYLHAIEYLLRTVSNATLTPAAGMYYQLKNRVSLIPGIASQEHRGVAFEKSSRSKQILRDDQELRAFIADSIMRAESYVDGMAGGTFPLTTPDKIDKVCGFCSYQTICRIQSAHHVQPKEEEQT